MLNFQSEILISIAMHLLHKTGVVNYKFRNFTDIYILCSVLISRAFKIDYIKIQFHFY